MHDGAPAVIHRTVTQDGSAVERLAAQLGETLRLATQIADDAARSDIESFCRRVHIGRLDWYDTDCMSSEDPAVARYIATALRYLRLREHIVFHPMQAALVRFASTFLFHPRLKDSTMQDSPANDVPTEPGTPFAGGFYAGRLRVGDALFALVVAPKERGYASGKWLDIPDSDDGEGDDDAPATNVPGACSYCDGLANTNALAEAGSPIANWARGLAIGGHTGWYVPSRDELELLYRAFKPTTRENWTWRHGDNPSSVPVGYPYSETAPKQTCAPAFQQDGAEALEPAWHWSSTQYSGVYAWCQYFNFGYQNYDLKSYEGRVRAVRRIQITA